MTTMRGEGSRLWMRSRHGREGRKASWISQESYMRCTGGVAPWRRDGDKGPSYYAVCPLCDNPIQIDKAVSMQGEQ